MVDRYAPKRARVAAMIERWNVGNVTLVRKTRADPDVATPWTPGAASLDVYSLSARADGVIAEYIDGTNILANDRMVIASPKATHETSNGEALDPPVAVELVPRMSDTLQIDGVDQIIKAIKAVPASGQAAMFHIIVKA